MMYKELDSFIAGDLVGYKKITEIGKLEYYKGGNVKLQQIADIQRYFEIEKVKTKYRFIKRYDTPLEKEDGRGSGNNTKYADDIETVVLFTLGKCENKQEIFSIPQALLMAQLVNSNYNITRREIPTASKILDVDESTIYDFYNDTHRRLRNTFERALDKMANKALIMYNNITMVCYKDVIIEQDVFGDPIIDNNGKLKYKVTEVHRPATQQEKDFILKCEGDALDKLNCETKKEVFISKRWSKYRDLIIGMLKKNTNIKYYYDAYDITLNPDRISRIIKNYEVKGSKSILNHNTVESLRKSAYKMIESGLNDNNCDDVIKIIDTVIDVECEIDMKDKISTYKTVGVDVINTYIPKYRHDDIGIPF